GGRELSWVGEGRARVEPERAAGNSLGRAVGRVDRLAFAEIQKYLFVRTARVELEFGFIRGRAGISGPARVVLPAVRQPHRFGVVAETDPPVARQWLPIFLCYYGRYVGAGFIKADDDRGLVRMQGHIDRGAGAGPNQLAAGRIPLLEGPPRSSRGQLGGLWHIAGIGDEIDIQIADAAVHHPDRL